MSIAWDLCTEDRHEEALTVLRLAMNDSPRNLDPWIFCAVLAQDLNDAVDLLLEARQKGQIHTLFDALRTASCQVL